MVHFVFMAFGILFGAVAFAVPPSPADRLWEEVGGVKALMMNIAGQLEKFNSLYLGSLEQRMVSMASALAGIDSNVRSLQERAHVWDTFQLHVAAWNEQINTLDKKVEIISKGQEKMFTMDTKMSSISNIEYKVERIIGKLDVTDNTLQALTRTLENQNRDPLLGEFTTRGVLSTLKIVERKVDRILTGMIPPRKNLTSTVKKNTTIEPDPKGRLLIKCNTPPIVEELLHDMAAKVDVMFDRISNKYDDKEPYMELESEEIDASIETMQELRSEPTEEKLVNKLWRKLTAPYKKTAKFLENIEEKLSSIDNSTYAVVETGSILSQKVLNCCHSTGREVQTFTENADILLKRIERMVINIDNKETQLYSIIDNHFKQQKLHFTDSFKTILNLECPRITSTHNSNPTVIYATQNDDTLPTSNVPTESSNSTLLTTASDDEFTYKARSNNNTLTDCSDLSFGFPSGVYMLTSTRKYNERGRDFNTRFCDMKTDGGGWTVLQRRGDFGDPVQNFSLSWDEYKQGFGKLEYEFWWGNDFIHRLTRNDDMVLRIELEDFEGNTAWAEYDMFKIDNEYENYRLHVSGYSGNASDSLTAHNNAMFSTYDRGNDDAPPCCPCAPAYGGGWWFYSCFEANLNGVYYHDPKNNDYFRGIIWEHWLGNYSLRKTQMMIRPRRVNQNKQENKTSTQIPEDP